MAASSTNFSFDPPTRILLGPGPSEVPARVLAAMARPTVGYLDPSYTALLEEVQPLLRMLFRTQNEATFAITGAGTAAMEAAVLNALEPGDAAVVCVHGYFGDRMRQIMERAGARVHVVQTPWGQPTDPQAVADALAKVPDAKAVGVIHGETSTGVMQAIEPIAKLAHDRDALLIVDTVASLGGTDFRTDDWGADVVYTGSQKCLSVPPGISPITFSPRAMDRVAQRGTPCRSWYLDVELNLTYWRQPHRYHHTGPINLTYALYEGLRIVAEEGLDRRVATTRATAEALWAGLEAMGLGLVVAPEHRLPTLTTVRVPDGVDEARVRSHLMSRYGIEIAGGLGTLAGKAWRVGLMGASCQARHLTLLLSAIEEALRDQRHTCPPGAGVEAAAGRFAAS
jgi:alanine-glyoxylate transaminase/serine-glyoxylate transaminase/serine-pyruvate transaminase